MSFVVVFCFFFAKIEWFIAYFVFIFSIFAFWIVVFLTCGVQFQKLNCLKNKKKKNKKSFLKKINEKLRNVFQKDVPQDLMFKIIDNTKCLMWICISALVFNNKYITDITAIVAHLSNSFPIFNKFKSESKNFISIIITGFVLDKITGISMLVAFFIGAKKSGYTSVAITSAMFVGIVKTLLHIFLFDNNDYVQALFFIFFGCLAISKNKRTIIYICEKAVPEDFWFYRKKKKEDEKSKKEKVEKKEEKKDEQQAKKKKKDCSDKYKKVYKNNKKYEKTDKKFERREERRQHKSR